ncbi:MAG: PfaD family polyunsaturated fatty acid/polyketide biosynthesis protein [Gemmatimonadetes bacterium]|nr:PfaD family polyunsaturated fatty acid/polyketide biosynthesis protein [Gemmatimonadota bacterium]
MLGKPLIRSSTPIGSWSGPADLLLTTPEEFAQGLRRVGRPLYAVEHGDGFALADSGSVELGVDPQVDGLPLLALAPPCKPQNFGSASFASDHGVRFCYLTGAMANGIGSAELVEAIGHAGMLAFFGAAGLGPDTVEDAIDRISTRLGDLPWGFNLIHSPYEPLLEEAIADLYVRRGVTRVSASAYMDLTLPLVRYRLQGIHSDTSGRVVTPNRLLAKVSRIEVARKFLAPPPAKMVAELVARGDLSEEQARMAQTIPVAQDLTVEADSGGHTDNRPAIALLPTMLALRDRIQAEYAYSVPLRVGSAGGISTPHSVAAAFAMGADYVMTGSVNQACREAGTSDTVRKMLAQAEQADVTMAPAADMFEMGVRLQVLKRGTMFPMRAHRLYDLYRAHGGLEDLSDDERQNLEETIFRKPLEEIWNDTRRFWVQRDVTQTERAEGDPKHRMALVFRWYLGMSSRWANSGEPGREMDYQIWCGPAMGAFNEWVRDSDLDPWENRRVVTVAHNMLHGAAVITRAAALRSQGVDLPAACVDVVPRDPGEIEEMLT